MFCFVFRNLQKKKKKNIVYGWCAGAPKTKGGGGKLPCKETNKDKQQV